MDYFEFGELFVLVMLGVFVFYLLFSQQSAIEEDIRRDEEDDDVR